MSAEQKKLQVEEAVKQALVEINQVQRIEADEVSKRITTESLTQSLLIFEKTQAAIYRVNAMVHEFEREALQKDKVVPFHFNPEEYYLMQTQTIDGLTDTYITKEEVQAMVDAIVPEEGTVAVSIIGGVGLGVDVSVSFDLFLDDDGDMALGLTLGGGITSGANLSLGVAITKTDADDVEKLAAGGDNIGGSALAGAASVGLDQVHTEDSESGESIDGVSQYITVGPDVGLSGYL